MAMNRKASYSDCPETAGKSAGEPSQDWVCVKCNNLNFSFRKKCNRCKVQSREDNQQALYLDYYYYNHYYNYQPAYAPKSDTHSAIIPPTTPKKSFSSQSDIVKEKENSGLPSVSPLLKKYKAERKKKEASKSGWKSEPIGKLFGEEIWNS